MIVSVRASGLVSQTKITYGDFLKRPKTFFKNFSKLDKKKYIAINILKKLKNHARLLNLKQIHIYKLVMMYLLCLRLLQIMIFLLIL